MFITYEPEENTAFVPCSYLSRFARSKSGISASKYGFAKSDSDFADGDVFLTDHIYSVERNTDDFVCLISGRADCAYSSEVGFSVGFILETRRKPAMMNPLSDSAFLANAMAVAYAAALEEGLDKIRVRLTFRKSSANEENSYEAIFSLAVLEKMFDAVFARALPFIRICVSRLSEGAVEMQDMAFPYPSMRGGQRDFIIEAFRSIRTRKRLVVSAPTGIGKTMSALYPAVKALGEGFADKVFYLTAKGVTGNAAMDAAAELGKQAPHLRAVMLSAKERGCPEVTPDNPFSQYNCIRGCKYTDEVGGVSYEERRDGALLDLLGTETVFTPDIIAKTAEKYSLCPYELSLDLSEYCDIIVCDYNYVFDNRIKLKRYFDRAEERYVFLVDEAHNLPDRARDIYSASLIGSSFSALAENLPQLFPGDTPLADAVGDVCAVFAKLRKLCEIEHTIDPATGGDLAYGFFIDGAVPDFISEPLTRFRVICDDRLKRDPVLSQAHLEKPRSYVRKFLDSIAVFDKQFRFCVEVYGEKTTVRSICLDPASLLDEAMKMGVSSILFSATLSPMDYFSDVLGCSDAVRLELDSPYDPANVCIACMDKLSTRLTDRRDTAVDAAEIISAVAEAKAGNYIAFFPSYEYMRSVLRAFRSLDGDTKVIVQHQGMNIGERSDFLAEFARSANAENEPVIGFCVLGGMFSEGIDLSGDKLIGAIIFGTGMPGMSTETNIMREYYESTRENGQDYAYTYPGFNKVLQAAGRVIRSETDRGVIVLVDDRFGERGMQMLFPSHWKNLRYVGDVYSLSALLGKFWGE